LIRQAPEAGCHVLCEKPLSDVTAHIDEIQALAREKNLKTMVALCFRFQDGLTKAKQAR